MRQQESLLESKHSRIRPDQISAVTAAWNEVDSEFLWAFLIYKMETIAPTSEGVQ